MITVKPIKKAPMTNCMSKISAFVDIFSGHRLINIAKKSCTGKPPSEDLHIFRRDGRAVECTGLENQHGCKPIVGSNPTPSAIDAEHMYEI